MSDASASHPPGAGVQTPWGNADDLRLRGMPPGRGNELQASRRSHRERLFGAMVAASSMQGYEATRVSDLVSIAGVSRAAFYEQFTDKEGLLLETVDALIGPTVAIIEADQAAPVGRDRLRQTIRAFLELVASQPAASRLGFIEAYAVGRSGEAAVERGVDAFQTFALRELESIPRGEELPPIMVRALIGGLLKVVQRRLYRDEADRLPELADELSDWALSYPAPPGSLEGPRRRGRQAHSFEERQAVAYPPGRVMRAAAAVIAEQGYRESTVADIVRRAETSQRAFYGHFRSKEEAVLATLESGASQMLGSVLPAVRRSKGWGKSIRAAYEAMFAFAMEEPEYTRLGAVEIYQVGREALRTRDAVMERLEDLLVPGYECSPDTPAIAGEAIGGSIYSLIHDQVKRKGPEALPELAPLATFMTLAPFLGAKEAYARAMEEPEKW